MSFPQTVTPLYAPFLIALKIQWSTLYGLPLFIKNFSHFCETPTSQMRGAEVQRWDGEDESASEAIRGETQAQSC